MKLHFFIMLFFFVTLLSCNDYNHYLDSVDNSIYKRDTVIYEIDDIKVAVPVYSIKKELDNFLDNFNPTRVNNIDSVFQIKFQFPDYRFEFNYLNKLGEEIKYQRENYKKPPEAEKLSKFTYARYYYNGFLDEPSIGMEIFADSNKKVTAVKLEEIAPGERWWENFYYEGNEISLIGRGHSTAHSVGFMDEHVSWEGEGVTFKFIDNSLCEITDSKPGKDGEAIRDRDISERKSKKYLRKALYVRMIAEAIIHHETMNCRVIFAKFGSGTNKEFTKFFYDRLSPEFLELANDSSLSIRYKADFEFNLDKLGDINSFYVVNENRFGYQGDDKIIKLFIDNIRATLSLTQWAPEMRNCRPVESKKRISAAYSTVIYKSGRFEKITNPLDRFWISQEEH